MANNEIKCIIKIDSASVFNAVCKKDGVYILPDLDDKYQYAALTQDDMVFAFQDETLTHGSGVIACKVGGIIMSGDKLVDHFKLVAGVE